MSPELTKQLFEKYPKIFADRDKDPSQTLICFGLECGDGWFNIINMLCLLIQNNIDSHQKHIDWAVNFNAKLEEAKQNDWKDWPDYATRETRNIPDPIPQVIATQVKEKFGTLRFYYTGGDEYVEGLVAMADGMSGVTCEVCGNPGKITGTGWIRTLCDAHTT